jgi:hypothetical protein
MPCSSKIVSVLLVVLASRVISLIIKESFSLFGNITTSDLIWHLDALGLFNSLILSGSV